MRQIFPNLSLPGAAGALALLFAAAVFFGGGDAPLSVATAVAADDCTALTQTPSRRRGHIGAQPLSIASRTPENVSATCNEAETLEGRFYRRSISVTWDVPSNFPQSLLSGYCTEKSHDSGEVLEWCDESSHAASQTRASISACFTDTGGEKTCPDGTFYIRVTVYAVNLFASAGTNPKITGAVFSTTEYYDTHEVRDGLLRVQAKSAADLNALASPPSDPFTVEVRVTMANDEGQTASGTINFETTYGGDG